MAKYVIEKQADDFHEFFRILKDGMVCFQGDNEEECHEFLEKERAKNAIVLFEHNDYELSKMSVKFAESRGMGIGYDNCDYCPKKERDYHMLNIYLDLEANDDGAVIYEIREYDDEKFIAVFYACLYEDDASEIIKGIVPKEIRGEKELRKVIKDLESRREEILELV